jgi:hypothetical protein
VNNTEQVTIGCASGDGTEMVVTQLWDPEDGTPDEHTDQVARLKIGRGSRSVHITAYDAMKLAAFLQRWAVGQ